MSDNEKKIIIDDDWKSQVAAEKEALKQEAVASDDGPAEADAPAAPPQPGQMPPASFEMLVTTFATEAMVAMGQIPNPMTNEVSFSPDHASYAIDMLAMLKDKTKGNLDDAEESMLIDVLHQLRMAFIAVKQQASTAD